MACTICCVDVLPRLVYKLVTAGSAAPNVTRRLVRTLETTGSSARLADTTPSRASRGTILRLCTVSQCSTSGRAKDDARPTLSRRNPIIKRDILGPHPQRASSIGHPPMMTISNNSQHFTSVCVCVC